MILGQIKKRLIYLFSFIKIFFLNFFNFIFLNFCNISFKKEEKNIHNQVDLFLTDINELWKTNKIENINLLCDILCLYFKYKPQQIEIDSNKSVNDKQDIHMRYYILGWYIYQNMK
jgi:hypothetical protein